MSDQRPVCPACDLGVNACTCELEPVSDLRRTTDRSAYQDRHAEALGHDRPHWRSRMYGRCRYHGWNRLAWLFADKQGRVILRRLREIKR